MINTTDLKGGTARVMEDLTRELRKNGHIVRCLVGYKYKNDKNIDEISLNWFWKLIENKLPRKMRLYFRHLRSFITSNDIDYFDKDELVSHPWFKEADIVHMHNIHGQYFNLDSLSKICLQKPVIWTIHDMWPLTSHCGFCFNCSKWNGGNHFSPGIFHYQPIAWDNSEYLFKQKQKIFSKSKFFIVTPSVWLKSLVLRNESLSKKICKVIPNGIDTHVFRKLDKNKCRKLLKLKSNGKIYIFVANKGLDDERKGGKFLKNIIKNKIYSKDLFLIVGGGKGLSENNVRHFSYILDKKRMARLYNSADAYIDFSYIESYGLARAEAKACGLKTLNLNDFSFENIIHHLDMGVKLEERSEVISIKQMTEQYIKLYKRILA